MFLKRSYFEDDYGIRPWVVWASITLVIVGVILLTIGLYKVNARNEQSCAKRDGSYVTNPSSCILTCVVGNK